MMEIEQDSKRANGSSGVQDGDSDASGCGSFFGGIIWVFSMILIIATFPLSLFVCVRMVQVITVFMEAF